MWNYYGRKLFYSVERLWKSQASTIIPQLFQRQSLRRMLNLAKYFQEYSSLKFNVEKCEACWIGKAKGQSSKPVQSKWINLIRSSIKISGAHFSYKKQLIEKMIFNQVTTDCRISLNIWKQRWLSLAGKI